MTISTIKRPRTPKLPKPLESEVQKACIQIMQAAGWRVFRRNTGAMSGTHNGKRRFIRFAEKGQSDVYGFIPKFDGRHVEVEIKRKGERPTLDQVQWLQDCHFAGCLAIWVDNPDRCREVVRHIDDYGGLVYLGTKRVYPVKDKSGKKIGEIEGPSGDYKLV